MAELLLSSGGTSPYSSSSSEESTGSLFSLLKPFCVRLLDLVQNPKRDASFIPEMADLLRCAPPESLQPCLDYTLLPLLLLLDAAVQCRKEKRVDGDVGFLHGGALLGGLSISDSLAEGVLQCLEELLGKCQLGSVNQMVVVLKKITFGAMLSPSEASEEFREGIIKCFKAMLLRIRPCSSKSCSCKQRNVLSNAEFLSLRSSFQHGSSSLPSSDPEECLLAFLQSQNASAAVGHWLSLLLQVAEFEASKGNRGSATLRKEAFLTLRILVSTIGNVDALAFFLPGIVSRFAKVLFVTKTMMSGAAGSSGSIEHAVRGLTEFLIIVLEDKANVDGLQMSPNDGTSNCSKERESSLSLLEALRALQRDPQSSLSLAGDTFNQSALKENETIDREGKRPLYVHRTKEWIKETSRNVNKLLSATFPHLCVHPSEKVRRALVDGLHGLLSNCSCTLLNSKLILLECLCVLVGDDTESVSFAAKECLESLFAEGQKFLTESEIFDTLTSLIEGLPRVVLGSEEKIALSHARKLLVLIYFAGPDVMAHYLSQSSTKTSHLLDCLCICLSQNSQFTGSVNKLLTAHPLSPGYLLSVAELKAGYRIGNSSLQAVPKISVVQDKDLQSATANASNASVFPHMPPWFSYIGSHKLYMTIAGILRLIGLSVMTGNRAGVTLYALVDTFLDDLHNLVVEIQMREYNKEGWRTWYSRNSSGKLLRKSSASVCMLNEMIYGLSHQSVKDFSRMFSNSRDNIEEATKELTSAKDKISDIKFESLAWKIRQGKDNQDHVIQCVGSILREYLCPELWELPLDQNSFQPDHDAGDYISLHFSRDSTMLQQVILDGLGVFSVVLGKYFVTSGFLHSSLYLLLQNLICSNSQIRIASDSVLRALSYSSGHDNVSQLVVANADYIVDAICRQLRHLDINPHAPNVLAAMLSYVGAANSILPLLEEPMQAVTLELEVLGRQQHPELTIPFIRAVSEIAKAAINEAWSLPDQAESFLSDVNAKLGVMREKNQQCTDKSPGKKNIDDMILQLQYWDEMLINLNEMRRYRQIVGSLAGSCMKAANPLLSSLKESACLVALEIIENVSATLAKVEEAYKHEKQTKALIEKAIQLLSLNDEDSNETIDEGDENRLLPAINKIWPYLVLCLKNKISVSVIRRCTEVLSKVVEIGGGDFFVRRFHNDGHVIWKLLTLSPFQRKGVSASDEKRIVLPYRSSSLSDDPMSELSSRKIQVAVLDMIAKISSNKRSCAAFRTILKRVAGLVVGIACSKTANLGDSSIKALTGLAIMDPDLIWILLADVYYSLNKLEDFPMSPGEDFAGISKLLPPPSSTKEYLYVQYAGERVSFDIDASSVDTVFRRLQSEGCI